MRQPVADESLAVTAPLPEDDAKVQLSLVDRHGRRWLPVVAVGLVAIVAVAVAKPWAGPALVTATPSRGPDVPSSPPFPVRSAGRLSPIPSLPVALPAGAHQSWIMQPHIAIITPDGFFTLSESTDNLWVSTGNDTLSENLVVARVAGGGVIDALRRTSGLDVGTPLASTVGGFAGRSLDVAVPASAPGPTHLFDGADPVVGHLDSFGLAPGSQGRVIELKVGDSTIMIEFDAPTGEYPRFLIIAEGVVSSLRFVSP
jgi:hypothetical protein